MRKRGNKPDRCANLNNPENPGSGSRADAWIKSTRKEQTGGSKSVSIKCRRNQLREKNKHTPAVATEVCNIWTEGLRLDQPTWAPGRTGAVTVVTTRRPSASTAERIMPWDSMPIILRSGKLAI